MSEGERLYTIGELARRAGVPVRTVRFWSDAGLLPRAGRSAGGYRLYDEAAAARLGLVRMLRDLGVGLEAVREVLARRVTPAEVAAAHVRVVEAEIRASRARLAVLRLISVHGGTTEETLMVHRLAESSAEERRRIVADFVAGTFEGIDLPEDGAVIAEWMCELPDSPTDAQLEAWVELAELIADEGFGERLRLIAAAGPGPGPDLRTRALAEVVTELPPDSPEAGAIVERVVAGCGDRRAVRAWLETVADARVERYWELLAALNGHAAGPPAVPALTWLAEALRVRER